MTNLNEIIAKAKGWKFDHRESGDVFLKTPEGKHLLNCGFELFDYLNDARLYMRLFEEILFDSTYYGIRIIPHYEEKSITIEFESKDHESVRFICDSESIGEAICRAWLCWKGIEI